MKDKKTVYHNQKNKNARGENKGKKMTGLRRIQHRHFTDGASGEFTLWFLVNKNG